MKVWAIYYKVKAGGVWSKRWSGPIGIYHVRVAVQVSGEELPDILKGRPFFYRTNKQAMESIKRITNNKSIRYKTKPLELTWR